MFCPKCGSLMVPKRGSKKGFVCSSCGFEEKTISKQRIKEKISDTSSLEVVDEKIMEKQTLPQTNAKCDKCGKVSKWKMKD